MSRKYDICIIGGLGHVGLPLGIVFASKGLKVCLNDINEDVAKIVKNGDLPYVEHGAELLLEETLKNGNLKISLNPQCISESETVIIAVGTPVDEYLSPKVRQFLNFFDNIKKYLDQEQLIIIRSSVFPKICEQILKNLGTKSDWDLSYCPERIIQGYAVQELSKLPQVVSGYSDSAVDRASKLFSKISPKIIRTSIGEAELVKLFSNSFRYIQFSIANQFYMIAEDFGENYDRIREIMIDGYDRANGLPSAGFAAGPCLLKDTMQISAFNNNQFQLGQAAMNINEGLPNYIVEKLKIKFKLSDVVVGILGMAFKANVDDIRDSLSYKLRKILIFNGASVICSDPYVKDNTFLNHNDLIKKSDIIIIAAPHSQYKDIKIKNKYLVDLFKITNNRAQ